MSEKTNIELLRFSAHMRQRKRGVGKTRIDYYISPEALRVIDSLRSPKVGYDASSILNRIVIDWANTGITRHDKKG